MTIILQAAPHCYKIKMDSRISNHLLIFDSLGNCSQTFTLKVWFNKKQILDEGLLLKAFL